MKVFRIGDKVKIINPELFVSCGVPSSDAKVTEEQTQAIWELMEKFGVQKQNPNSEKIFRNIAQDLLSTIRYEIKTQLHEGLSDGLFRVLDRRLVKTYSCQPGLGCEDGWWDGYDHEKPYIKSQKFHTILKITSCDSEAIFEIEEKNVALAH